MNAEFDHVPAPAAAPLPSGYGDFLQEIKAQIRQRQFQALRAANRELLQLYWWLGENISRRQSEQGWGKSVVENLARDLQAEFPGRNGFSVQNLWLMRQFFNEYVNLPNLQSLIGEISWAKNLLIMARCNISSTSRTSILARAVAMLSGQLQRTLGDALKSPPLTKGG